MSDRTRGRRAADRRRERQTGGVVDDGAGTRPGSVPLSSFEEELDDELDDELDEDEASDPGDTDLPLVSQVREIVDDPVAPAGTTPGRRRTVMQTSMENDPEASFVKAVRSSQQERSSAARSVEATAVRPAPDRPPRRGGRVIVLAGPDEGGEADIELFPSLVGRAEKAEIGLTDPAVSKEHLEIRFGEDGFTLVDLGSMSGTLLNGRVLTAETRLAHGDVIALGKTELRFVRGDKLPQARPAPEPEPEPEPPPVEPTERLTRMTKAQTMQAGQAAQTGQTAQKPAPRPPPGPEAAVVRAKVRKLAGRVIAASIVVLVVVAAGKLVHDRFFTDKAPAQIRAQVAELLADGRNRLRAQDVDGAHAAAKTVLALDPKNEEAQSLLRMSDTERDARDAIDFALRLGDEERDVEAYQILKRVPDASVFAPTRDRLRHTLDERGRVRARRALEAMLDQGRIAEALEAAEKLVATWPNDDEGKALLERARAAKEATPKNPGLSAARAAFASGDVAGARKIASDNGLKGYVRDVDAFQSALEKGKAKLSRFDDDAADSLDVAFRLLPALGANSSSPVFAGVRKPYAKALLVSGTADLDKNPCAAARKLYKAARVTPDDPAIQAKLRELDARAVAALDRARAAKHEDAERASAVAREGLCLAKTGSKTADELRALSRL